MYLHRECSTALGYMKMGSPAYEVAGPIEAVCAMHPNETILCSLDCPGVDISIMLELELSLKFVFCFEGSISKKIPVELLNYPLTGHNPSLGENFHMFHPLTLQILGRIVPEQKQTNCQEWGVFDAVTMQLPVGVGQVNHQRDSGTGG